MKKIRFSLLAAALLISSMALTSCDDILHTAPAEVLTPLVEVANLSYTKDTSPRWESFGAVTALNQYADTYSLSLAGQSYDGNLLFFTGSRQSNPSFSQIQQNESIVLVYHVQRNEILYTKEYVAHIPEAVTLESDAATHALTGTTVKVIFETVDPETNSALPVSCLFTVYTSETDPSTGRTTETTVLFDAEGREVASAAGKITVYHYGNNYFEFDRTMYRLSEDALSKIATIPTYNRTVPFDYFDGTYFYCIGSRSVEIYNTSMTRIFSWEEANTQKEVYLHVLDNGNILVQTTELLPEDATEYDLLSGKDKYRFSSTLLKPFIDSELALELDFIVWDVQTRKANPETLSVYHPTVSNIATVTYIQDQRVDMNTRMTVSLTNEAKMDQSLKIVESHVSVQELTSSGNGYFIVSENDQHHVFDKSGTAVATYNQELRQNHSFLFHMASGTVYSYALDTLYQCDEHTYIAEVGDNYVLLCRRLGSQTTYIYFDGIEKVLYVENAVGGNDATKYYRYHHFYALRNAQQANSESTQAEWSFYNISGKYLGMIKADGLHLYHESAHGALLQDANGHFYRIGE